MTQPLKSSSNAGKGCLLGFAVIWTGFSLFWTVMALASGAGLMALFGLPFLAIGVGLLASGVAPWIAGIKLSPPEVTLSRDALRPGEEFSLRFKQEVRKPVDVTRMTFQLVFRETATYRRGTNTVTVTHELPIEEWEQPGGRFETGRTLLEERALRVPPEGMHTFIANRNKLQWFLKVNVQLPNWPDVKEEYEVRVLPERLA